MDEDIRNVRAQYSALRDLIVAKPGGAEDPAALLEVERLCAAASAALDDSQCRAQLAIVRAHARVLFSAAEHRRWARPRMSGPDYLRLQILIALEALNSRLLYLATQHGEAQPMR